MRKLKSKSDNVAKHQGRAWDDLRKLNEFIHPAWNNSPNPCFLYTFPNDYFIMNGRLSTEASIKLTGELFDSRVAEGFYGCDDTFREVRKVFSNSSSYKGVYKYGKILIRPGPFIAIITAAIDLLKLWKHLVEPSMKPCKIMFKVIKVLQVCVYIYLHSPSKRMKICVCIYLSSIECQGMP